MDGLRSKEVYGNFLSGFLTASIPEVDFISSSLVRFASASGRVRDSMHSRIARWCKIVGPAVVLFDEARVSSSVGVSTVRHPRLKRRHRFRGHDRRRHG